MTRSPRRRPVGLAVALAAALGACPSRARAGEPLPDETRRRAEDAFVSGRLDDLDAALGTSTAPIDLEALAVRDLYWRPRGGAAAALPAAAFDGSLSGRRLAWLRDASRLSAPGEVPYPMPAAGETDPWPLVTALVLDRLERESVGDASRAMGERLLSTRDPRLEWFFREYAAPAYGVPIGEPSEQDAKRREETDRLAARNARILVLALLGFLILSFALGRLAGKDAAETAPGTRERA